MARAIRGEMHIVSWEDAEQIVRECYLQDADVAIDAVFDRLIENAAALEQGYSIYEWLLIQQEGSGAY